MFRGVTGNPADVTVKTKSGAVAHRKFTVDHAGARLESVTVTGGSLPYDATIGLYRYGSGVRLGKALASAGALRPAAGAGGVVSNCVFTGNSTSYKYCAAIVYVNAPDDKTLFTCCVVTNNTTTRQYDSTVDMGGTIHIDAGRFTSSLVVDNKVSNNGGEGDAQDLSSVLELRGGSVENCMFTKNSVRSSFDPALVRVFSKGRVYNTVFADNSVSTNKYSKTDWNPTNRYWAVDVGASTDAYTNCVFKGTDIPVPNATCFATNNLGYFDAAANDYRLVRRSPLRNAAETNGVWLAGTDLLGKPRVNAEGKLDIGPIAYDPTIVQIAGECLTESCFDDERVSFRVTVDEGFGDEPQYYWTVTKSSGSVTYSTSSPDFSTFLGAGDYSVTLSASNLTAGTGSSVLLDRGVTVYQRRFYAKAGNPNAAAPYATEETAADDLQRAIDAVTRDGAEVVALPGVFQTASNVIVRAHQIVLRGSTGRPEDVVISNTNKAIWAAKGTTDENSGWGEGRCLVLDAGPAARVESITVADAYAKYAAQYGAGMLLADWEHRSCRPKAGRGGVVSNCVVRNCYAAGKYGITPGIYANGADYLITHTVVTNCRTYAGNINGGRFQGVALELGNGARAEHCLIADNRSDWVQAANYADAGRGQAAVLLRENSKLRFCTVVSNKCSMVGGVNLNNPEARMENCIVLGNLAIESLMCPVTTNRFNCWAMMSVESTVDLLSSGKPADPPLRPYSGTTLLGQDKLADVTSNEIAYVQAHPEVVDAAIRNTITDYAVAGTTGILSTPAETFRNAAKRNYRLKGRSPAVDRVLPAEAGAMPSVDLMGNPRLAGPGYDLGCYEWQPCGMMLIVR